MVCGSVTIARAKLTRFCIPPDSSDGNLYSIPLKPTKPSLSEIIFFKSSSEYLFLISRRSLRAKDILSATFRESNNAEYWNTIATSPSDVIISPPSFSSNPHISFSTVLFPEPENPTIASVSPSDTSKEMLSNTLLSSNIFVKFLTFMLIIHPYFRRKTLLRKLNPI